MALLPLRDPSCRRSRLTVADPLLSRVHGNGLVNVVSVKTHSRSSLYIPLRGLEPRQRHSLERYYPRLHVRSLTGRAKKGHVSPPAHSRQITLPCLATSNRSNPLLRQAAPTSHPTNRRPIRRQASAVVKRQPHGVSIPRKDQASLTVAIQDGHQALGLLVALPPW
jgi:hypothetical protein